jgi:hypothetical protein
VRLGALRQGRAVSQRTERPHSPTPNPSLKAPTHYGSHRLAAPGQACYRPSAASRRLPSPVGLARTLGVTEDDMHSPRTTLLAILAGLLSSAAPAQPNDSDIVYKMSAFRIEIPRQGNDSPAAIEWSYPVVIRPRNIAERINAWLRQRSLEPLQSCADLSPVAFLKQRDRQVVRTLSTSKWVDTCGVSQSVVQLREAFGHYVTVQQSTAFEGTARQNHGLENILFNLDSRQPVEVRTLFKPEALDSLNEALATHLEKTRPDCNSRGFAWFQVSLRPPDLLFIEYPYDPAEWGRCGDGVEMLEGSVVSGLLANAKALRPSRKLVEAR